MPAPSNAVEKEEPDYKLLKVLREQIWGWQTVYALAVAGLWRPALNAVPEDFSYRYARRLRERADEFDRKVIDSIPDEIRDALTFAFTGRLDNGERPDAPTTDRAIRLLFAISRRAQENLNASLKEGATA